MTPAMEYKVAFLPSDVIDSDQIKRTVKIFYNLALIEWSTFTIPWEEETVRVEYNKAFIEVNKDILAKRC
ncbi:MAG: hypothetical protein A2Y38_11610 [Spirochaetes bacterium GWB1_59_5]|nr:MAG: hypothetical protein A2Y38_11610 [Spirochaetes bacterium GWB1_59_5]